MPAEEVPFANFSTFLGRLEIGDECWHWRGVIGRTGYGYFRRRGIDKTPIPAHRASYEVFVGPIPDGLVIDHLCSNRPCVRPDHLEAVTYTENNQRVSRRITHCPKGHPYSEENTRRHGSRRFCRTCQRVHSKNHYDKVHEHA